jgi:hypothetical protein
LTKISSASGKVASIDALSERFALPLALYGVRVSTIGALVAPLGMTITV